MATNRPVRVLKFGGTSVGGAEGIAAICEIVAGASAEATPVVVASALAGVTNTLINAATQAAAHDPAYAEGGPALLARHEALVTAAVPTGERRAVLTSIRASLDDVHDLLHGVYLVRECTDRTRDSLLSYGEMMACTIVAAALRGAPVDAVVCDARDFIVTDQRFGAARVRYDESVPRIRAALEGGKAVPVVPGFLGATPAGETTTLGRGGSDYTASILGSALEAERIEIWTDVNGVMSADPRAVPRAFALPAVSYDELMELAHFGAKVVHPPAVHPARERNIPLVIRNTFNRTFAGTEVMRDAPPQAGHPVRGVASVGNIALLRLEGDGMAGVPGVAARLFGVLGRDHVNVVLISQASSERSICFAVGSAHADRVREHVETEFALELRVGMIDGLVIEDDRAIIAAVGDGMRETAGLAGRLFSVLGRWGVNVQAIAQGSSELNISLVVAGADETRALRAIHDAFFLPEAGTAQLYLAGVGRVGAVLLEQIADQYGDTGPDGVTLAGVARSQTAVVDTGGIDPAGWSDRLAGGATDLAGMVDAAMSSDHPRRVFVDCTASEGPPLYYERLLRAGVAVVAANKRAVAGSAADYTRLMAAVAGGAGLYVETTVGAGLPLLRPLSDLVATGDRVQRIEGVLSGTLSYLFGQVMDGMSFSDALRDAFERGFTEPDPRDDLTGMDVVRKLVILARTAGLAVEPDEVVVEPVLSGDGVDGVSLEAFWEAVPGRDAEFASRREAAIEDGRRLCYLARIESGRARVGLEAVDASHPCWSLAGTDNLVAITSDRYAPTPLVVRGPGAGPAVTAAGVFADVLRATVELTGGRRPSVFAGSS